MDDEKNREYSRAPEFEDVLDLCTALNAAGAKYVLIGGVAVILHGYLRGTKDIDLLVETSPENVKKIKKALTYLPDQAILQMAEDEINKHLVVRIADEIVIDLMAKACGITYETASESIEIKNLEGVLIPIAGKEILILTKDTVRPSDKTDVQFLRMKIEEEKKIK